MLLLDVAAVPLTWHPSFSKRKHDLDPVCFRIWIGICKQLCNGYDSYDWNT